MSSISSETNITALTGPPFVVVVVNWALFGVLSIQVYLYFQAFSHDRSILKILVFGVYLLEMSQTLLLTETIWSMLASGFGNLEPLDQIGTTWLSVCCIGGLVGLLVQFFYAYRIVVISGKRKMPAFIIFMSLASFAGALASAVNTKRAKRFSNLEVDEMMTFAMLALWGGIGSVCDVAIAICMCYYLRKYSHDELGIFSRTQALLSKIIRITIETGTLTASVSILTLALSFIPPLQNTTYYQVTLSAQAKLYSTTLLALLNSRIKLGGGSESMTWRGPDLATPTPLPYSQESGVIEFNIRRTISHLQSTQLFERQEKNIPMEEIKMQNDRLGLSQP